MENERCGTLLNDRFQACLPLSFLDAIGEEHSGYRRVLVPIGAEIRLGDESFTGAAIVDSGQCVLEIAQRFSRSVDRETIPLQRIPAGEKMRDSFVQCQIEHLSLSGERVFERSAAWLRGLVPGIEDVEELVPEHLIGIPQCSELSVLS